MKYKYYYNNEPLVEYCKKHPEYRYDLVAKYISDKLKENPDRPVQEIIDEFMNKKHKTYTRYIINGMNLSRFCELEDISYTAVSKAISVAKKNPKYKDMPEEAIVQMVIDKYILGKVEALTFPEPKKLLLKRDEDKKD